MKSFYCELMTRDGSGIFRPLIISTAAETVDDARVQIKRSINANDSTDLGDLREAPQADGCTLFHVGAGTRERPTSVAPPLELGATSTTGAGSIAVAPYIHNGKPSVLVFVKTTQGDTFNSTLDGEPALAFVLSEDSPGKGNAPWEFGHQLAENWLEAVKLADKDSSVKGQESTSPLPEKGILLKPSE